MKKLLSRGFVLRFGLACAFLASSIMAFTAPEEFSDLVSGSFLAKILPVSVAAFVMFIGINDLVVALLLFVGWKTSKVAIWASIWLVGVILVIGVISLDALEHLAFLAIALALALHSSSE
ncbi:MAG: hypothetical protein V4486_03775 [Patescibacteria group bacterium]